MDKGARGVALVSVGSLTLVVMAHRGEDTGNAHSDNGNPVFLIALVGSSSSSFRSSLAIRWRRCAPSRFCNALRPWFDGKRWAIIVSSGTLTHMLLADAMALQFSRPLFMIPLAVFFLGEVAGWPAAAWSLGGRFLVSVLYPRVRSPPDLIPAPWSGRRGRSSGGLVVIGIKQLAKTEPNACHHVLLRVLECGVRRHSRGHIVGHAELGELALLIVVGFLGISG